jgi:5-methylcytosine-specific restriction protein B
MSEQRIEELPPHVATQVERVVDALARHGGNAIVALAGVPGTSKSYVSRLAARAFASEGCLREVQFHPGYTYEEFIEGPRFEDGMEMTILPGAFLELNESALRDPASRYVLLIEEMTRADLPRVLGELLTYVEYRDEDDEFTTMYRRDRPARVAPNIAILATYNPTDRSAIGLDSALIRRMRILDFPPSTELLREILSDNGVERLVADALVAMFDACAEMAGDRYEEIMPFGHAIFATVEGENDLYELWHQTIKRILVRPYAPRHELFDVIFDHYPWQASHDVSVIDGSLESPVSASAGEDR